MIATTEMRDERSSLVQMCVVFATLAAIVFGVEHVAVSVSSAGTFRTQAIIVDSKSQLGAVSVPATAMSYAEDDSTTDTTLAWFVTQGTNHVGTGGNNEQIPIVIRNTTNFDTTATNGHATGIDIAVTGGIAAGLNAMESIGIAISGHCSTANCTSYSLKNTDTTAIFENDGPVNFTPSSSVGLGVNVQNFRVTPTNPVTTADIDVGCAPAVDGFNLHLKNDAAGVALAGSLIGLDTTVTAAIRGGYLISRGAGGGFGGNNGGLAVSSGNGFPFTTSLANELNLFAEQGALVFGADAAGFTSATRLSTNNHWTQDLSTGLPGLDAGCTSGGGSLIVGNDNRFMVTTGATSTACTITYSKTHTTQAMCIITPYGTPTLPTCIPSATQMVCSTNAAATTYVFDCQSQPGGT